MSSKAAPGATLLFLILLVSIPDMADRPTNLAGAPATGTYGGITSLQATLKSANRLLSNETIDFILNGDSVGSATTNANGVATLNNVSLARIQAITYTNGVKAVFSGDGNFRGSQGTANLTVSRAVASVTPNPASKTYGSSDPALTGA